MDSQGGLEQDLNSGSLSAKPVLFLWRQQRFGLRGEDHDLEGMADLEVLIT
jgi:hypothetical protein